MVARDKEDLSGQQIGNYEIVSHIAARKASDLFLARDVKLERLVFLEVLRVTADEDEDLADRFQRRMETVSQLKDPHIAVISDIDVTDDGFPYAVIEYFPGISLAERLAELHNGEDTLPVIESLELVKQIAQGLSVAHAAGLIHHDLRPENIMLREDGMPVLIDLGVPIVLTTGSRAFTTAEGEMLDYAAPEEVEGKALTRRSNIYSLGVILYELLAGHRPKLPTLPFDIFPQANMPKEEPLEEARAGLAGETYRLVRNCLWRQEWSRFETADEMISAIETAIFAEQELPKAAGWAPRRRRSMALIVPVALIGLALLAFLLIRSVLGGRDEQVDGTSVAVQETQVGTPGTPVAGVGDEDGPTATPTASPTLPLPTESAGSFTISVLAPGAGRQFSRQDTINFDWFWPTLPEPGQHFAVFLIDGANEYALGQLTEPNNGAAYRVSVPVEDLPIEGGEVGWQVRLEEIGGGRVLVASDPVPIIIAMPEPTASATASPTPEPSATPCVVSPPPGWVLYSIRQGDSIAGLAARANVPVEDVLNVNCLPNDLLSVGQELWVPGASVPRTPTPPPSAPTSAPPTSAPPPTATSGSVLPTSTSAPPPPTNTSAPPPPTNTSAPPPPTDTPQVVEPSKTPPPPP